MKFSGLVRNHACALLPSFSFLLPFLHARSCTYLLLLLFLLLLFFIASSSIDCVYISEEG